MYAEPSNYSDIQHVPGCISPLGCRCAHYEDLNPRKELPRELRTRVESIDNYWRDPCRSCGVGCTECENAGERCCAHCKHGDSCEKCGYPRHPSRAMGSPCHGCGHRKGDGCTSMTDAGEVIRVGDTVRATFTSGLIDAGREFLVTSIAPDGRIGFREFSPMLGSPSGYVLVATKWRGEHPVDAQVRRKATR